MLSVDKNLEYILRAKRICRFCLTQDEPLTTIYSNENRLKSRAPLPLQIMACMSIEVFTNDGMPSTICEECRLLMDFFYRYKQVCKKSDTVLKQFPLTGVWPSRLEMPAFPEQLLQPKTETLGVMSQSPVISSMQAVVIKREPGLTPGKQCNRTMFTEEQPSQKKRSPPDVRATNQNLNKQRILNSGIGTSFLSSTATPTSTFSTLSLPPPLDPLSAKQLQTLTSSSVTIVNDKQLWERIGKNVEVKILNKNAPSNIARNLPNIRNNKKQKMMNTEAIKIENNIKTEEITTVFSGTNDDIIPPVLIESAENQAITNADPVETNVYPCPECERSYPLRQLLEIHMRNHERIRNFVCQLCDRSFFSKYDLGKHMLVHTGEKPFECVVCKKRFSRSTLLSRHEKTHTDQPKFLCVFCERPFLSQMELDKHVERHKKKRPFACKLCDKSFAFKQGLERHEMLHSSEQPHKCDHCETSFSTPSKLARHLTAHAGTRPYPCRLCSKSYLLSHHLSRHMRSHKEAPGIYKCNDCEWVFKNRDDLIYHSAVHATLNFTCPICKEAHKDVDAVTQHIMTHTNGEQYACEFCDLIFTTEEKLQAHSDNDHSEEQLVYRNDDIKRKSSSTVIQNDNDFLNPSVTIEDESDDIIYEEEENDDDDDDDDEEEEEEEEHKAALYSINDGEKVTKNADEHDVEKVSSEPKLEVISDEKPPINKPKERFVVKNVEKKIKLDNELNIDDKHEKLFDKQLLNIQMTENVAPRRSARSTPTNIKISQTDTPKTYGDRKTTSNKSPLSSEKKTNNKISSPSEQKSIQSSATTAGSATEPIIEDTKGSRKSFEHKTRSTSDRNTRYSGSSDNKNVNKSKDDAKSPSLDMKQKRDESTKRQHDETLNKNVKNTSLECKETPSDIRTKKNEDQYNKHGRNQNEPDNTNEISNEPPRKILRKYTNKKSDETEVKIPTIKSPTAISAKITTGSNDNVKLTKDERQSMNGDVERTIMKIPKGICVSKSDKIIDKKLKDKTDIQVKCGTTTTSSILSHDTMVTSAAPNINKATKVNNIVATKKNESVSETTAFDKLGGVGKPQTKIIEMKIGDRMVKVQKILMTKNEVAAMSREGKIEIKGGKMILKNKTIAESKSIP